MIKWTLTALALAILTGCILLPAGWLAFGTIWDGGFTVEAYRKVFGKSYQIPLVLNTLQVSGMATLLAALFAVPLAVLLGRSDIPLRRLLSALALVPAILPPYLLALTWVFLIGNNGMLVDSVKQLLGTNENPFFIYGEIGAAFIMALSYFPIILLIAQTALQRVDPRLEEAALIHMSRLRVLWHVSLRLAAPTILASFLFIFLISLTTFDVPAFLMVDVYTIQITSQFNQSYQFREPMALAMPLIGFAVVLMLLLRSFLARRDFSTGASGQSMPLLTFGGKKRLAALLPISVVLLTTGLPAFVLVKMAGGWPMYVRVFRSVGGNFLVGVQTAAVAALIMTATGAIIAYWSLRGRAFFRWMLDAAYLLPFAMPASLVGIGLMVVYNRPGPIGDYFYKTYWVIVAADVARFLPFAVLIIRSSMRGIARSSDDAADVCGLSWWQKFFHVYLRRVPRPMLNAWIICFVFSLGELAATQLVYPPRGATLPIRLFSILHYGQDQMVSAIAVLLMTFAGGMFLLYYLVTNRRPELL